ncbi:ash family protein [Salmonella enterica]|nr:ash family protein [Salmonella enterica]EJZ6320245.1 ash family protein [Salmonella enterica]
MATPQCNQTRPKFQYRFMALDRADRQAKPCPANGQWGSYLPLNTFLQNFAISHLPLPTTACYRNSAPHKTGAGIRTPCKYKATQDAESVFFVVCYTRHSMAWCAHLMTNSPQAFDHATVHHAAHNGGICRSIRPVNEYIDKLSTEGIFRRQRMVTLAGLPKGRPVPLYAGSSNPVNVTAPVEIRTSSGDSLHLYKEAANMANSTHPQIVYLPLVDAVDTGASREWQLIQQTELNLLYRVKRALDRAGVEWIDTRTGETSPVKTDNAEGCDNAQ